MLHRPPAPMHIPTVENSVMSSDVSHEVVSHGNHYSSPAHHVHVSSPTHSVSSASESSTSGSQCSIHTNTCTQQTDNAATEDDTSSYEDEEVITEAEKPFSWENLSEVEDKESAASAMVEPEEVQLSAQQFSALISDVSTEQPPSLQEAFRRHKAGFISNSQSRLRQVKEKSKQRPTSHQQQSQHRTPSHGVSRNVATTKDPTSRVVQFSSPLITLQDTGVFTPPTIHRPNSRCTLHSHCTDYTLH